MNAPAMCFRWIFLIAFWISGSESDITHRKSYDFSAGLAFSIDCNRYSENVNISWNGSLESISGIQINGNTLWFLPAHISHKGVYSCFSRSGSDSWTTIFEISVYNESCPRRNRKDELMSTTTLDCILPNIFKIDPQAKVTWRKNCEPSTLSNNKVLLVNRSSEMLGFLTCFANFSYEGQYYISAQTTELYEDPPDYVVTKPEILFPKQERCRANIGQSLHIRCKALVGKNDDNETEISWSWNLKSLQKSFRHTRFKEGDREYMQSDLNISEVTADHFYTNFTCEVRHSTGSNFGVVMLVPDSTSVHCLVGLGLVLLLILVVSLVCSFRVDLVLLYRGCCPRRLVCNDGKLYDAYVSFLHADPLSSSPATSFALRLLPALLEDAYGYKLFISGRDQLPGNAIPEVVSDTLSLSRRLIIILTSPHTSSSPPQTHSLNPSDSECARVCLERRVGVYDALIRQGLKVILVEVKEEELPMDEDLLPESLQYIRRTSGILHWRPNAKKNTRFWKNLRYRMPPQSRRTTKKNSVI